MQLFCSNIGPVSSPSSAQKTVNPVFLSPCISVLHQITLLSSIATNKEELSHLLFTITEGQQGGELQLAEINLITEKKF